MDTTSTADAELETLPAECIRSGSTPFGAIRISIQRGLVIAIRALKHREIFKTADANLHSTHQSYSLL